MQLLLYLLPPCNSDTLHRLLHFLSTVAAHAEDSHDREGQEVRTVLALLGKLSSRLNECKSNVYKRLQSAVNTFIELEIDQHFLFH